MNTFEPIIGLEIHVELGTKSKMFCGCPADHFGKEPNTVTCPVCLGLPGSLPVPNKKAVEWTILLGLALNCNINEESKFDRKHYFYPDLPKGYQISQYDQPLCIDGKLTLDSGNQHIKRDQDSRNLKKTITIRRVHLEEDTGKLKHAVIENKDVTLVDFNRSGVPLIEIVTEPDFHSVDEVDVFVKKVQQIVRYLGISGADMEKGSMRIEPSISIEIQNELRSQPKMYKSRKELPTLPTYRVELKNINSFRFVRRALEYEIKRQTEMLQKGVQPLQQTRGWVEAKGVTVAQREKEEAHDYRYFSEPDIPPMRFAQAQISKLKAHIGELPDEKKVRFMKEYDLSDYDATILTETREKGEYYENCVKCQVSSIKYTSIASKIIANWIINKKVDIQRVSSSQLLDQIVQSTQTGTVSDEELEKVIRLVLLENPKVVNDYKKGKEQAIMYLVGQTLRQTKGKGDAQAISAIIKRLIV